MAAALPWIGIGLAAAGTFMSMQGQRAAGRAEARRGAAMQEVANFEAAQLEANAITTIATGQRQAAEERRRMELVESRALALAAASGGGVSDPTVVKIIAELSGEGAYRSAVAMYDAEEAARQMRLGAYARRYEGSQALESGLSAQRAFNLRGTGSFLTGAGQIGMSLYDKYGGTGPGETPNREAATTVGGTNQDAGLTGLGGYA